MNPKRFPELLRTIYEAVDELETMFPGRHFTPDGHMVGSIGEALAAFHYGITLLPASNSGHDGIVKGRKIEIKATQRNRIALSCEPELLLVLKIKRDGSFAEEYNGPGSKVWKLVQHKPMPKNGQYPISLATLRRLMKEVRPEERIKRQKQKSSN